MLGQKWWDETRYIAYEGNRRHCWACGSAPGKGRLDAHECYEIDYERGRAVFVQVVALCKLCHNFIHSNRLTALLREGVISFRFFAKVRDHGYQVLGELQPNDWSRLNFEPDFALPAGVMFAPVADWGDWRMVINGEEYGPKFATREEHDAHYKVQNQKYLERKYG